MRPGTDMKLRWDLFRFIVDRGVVREATAAPIDGTYSFGSSWFKSGLPSTALKPIAHGCLIPRDILTRGSMPHSETVLMLDSGLSIMHAHGGAIPILYHTASESTGAELPPSKVPLLCFRTSKKTSP